MPRRLRGFNRDFNKEDGSSKVRMNEFYFEGELGHSFQLLSIISISQTNSKYSCTCEDTMFYTVREMEIGCMQVIINCELRGRREVSKRGDKSKTGSLIIIIADRLNGHCRRSPA